MSDPTDSDSVARAVSHQGALLGQHDALLQKLVDNQQSTNDQIAQLGAMFCELKAQLTLTAPTLPIAPQDQGQSPPMSNDPHLTTREAHVPDPDHYRGDMGKCGGFLLQCTLVFSQKPNTYASDHAKIAYIMGLLQGKALDWATAIWQNNVQIRGDYKMFVGELKKVFDHPVQGKEASKRLLTIRQGSRSVAEYSVDFRTLAAEAGWDDAALQTVFTNGLNEQLKDELVLRDDADSLDSIISIAIKLDNRLRERKRERSNKPCPVNVSHSLPVPRSPPVPAASHHVGVTSEEPMQLGRASLTPAERHRRMMSGECIYCSQKGHFVSTCPLRPKEQARQ